MIEREREAGADTPEAREKHPLLAGELWFIVLAGLAVRILVAWLTAVVNPDGTLYIHQARAVYYGLWDQLTSCDYGIVHVSNYPFLIAGAYALIGDWVAAAKSISILFGALTIVPIYLLARRFFDRRISWLTALSYALIPELAFSSAQVLRDPIFWFFLSLGLYFFILALEREDGRGAGPYLALAALAFLVAAWARIEAVLFIGLSAGFLLLPGQPGKLRSLISFVGPLALTAAAALAWLSLTDHSAGPVIPQDGMTILTQPLSRLLELRQTLFDLRYNPPAGLTPDFLTWAGDTIWLIALAAVVHTTMETFFYPFFGLALIGLIGLGFKLKTDRRVLYLSLLAGLSLIALYIGVIATWFTIRRYWVLVILASFVFLGFGLENALAYLGSRFRIAGKTAAAIACAAIVLVSLPKSLVPHETDKAVYKDIGLTVARMEGSGRAISIVATGPSSALSWAIFYANLDYRGAPCPRPDEAVLASFRGKNGSELVGKLKAGEVDYFLWLERQWPAAAAFLAEGDPPAGLTEVGRWSHPDNLRMILFRVE